MNKHIIILIILTFLHGTVMLSKAADKTVRITADEQFRYAKSLYGKKDYFASVVEFNRFIHYFPDDPRTLEARFTIGLSWYDNGKSSEALNIFNDIMNGSETSPIRIEAFFMAAKCHEKSGNPVLGEVDLKNLIESSGDPAVKDRAMNAIGWLRLNSGKWDSARKSFETISEKGKTLYAIPDILIKLDKAPDIPQKNPVLAGTLSIVPGGGFLYCGRPKDALTAFLVNGGLIAAAAQSFSKKEYALGGVISFVEFGFYAGNIYGSISAAHKYNRAANRNFIETLKQSLNLNLFSVSDHGAGISVSCHF